MGKIAFVFPGQGAQYIGMGKDFYDSFEDSRKVFLDANKALGIDICNICFEENDKINLTEYTQPAMLTVSEAILIQVEKLGIRPDVCAGLSLGEYSALLTSKVLSFEDAIKVIRQRGILMEEAVPVGKGAMSAVIGTDKELIEKICNETEGIVSIANYNCPGQIVISGEAKAVEKAGESLKEAGARRVIPLKVSGPFHSAMLKEAGEKLVKVLEKVDFMEPELPYVSNTTALYIRESSGIKELLGRQIYSSVKWEQTVNLMIEDGVDTFIEIGPGKTISSFIKKIDKTKTVINIETVEDLEKLKNIK